jgi:DNA-binding CsgD family transcriptional regulator
LQQLEFIFRKLTVFGGREMFATNAIGSGTWTDGRIIPGEPIRNYYALQSPPIRKIAGALSYVVVDPKSSNETLAQKLRTRPATKNASLTDVEIETLLDIVVGLTDRAIARRRHISVRGVQNRLSMLLQKLLHGEDAHLRETANMEIFNARTRIIFECLRRGLISTEELSSLEGNLTEWLEDEFDFERNR